MQNQTPRLQIPCSKELAEYYNLKMTGEQKKLFREIIRKTMSALTKMSTAELKAKIEEESK